MGFQRRLALREHSVEIPGLGGPAHGLRIAHVSDFHFRRWNGLLDETRRCLATTAHDLLLITGDFSDVPRRWRHAANMCRRFFDGICPRLGAFAVLGNHDRRRLAEQPDMPFRWLRNQNVRLDVRGATLFVAGVEQASGVFGDLDAALAGIPAGVPVILLAHYPSTAFDLAANRVQLQVSGHTHGGQIRLPPFGCVVTNDRIPTRQSRGLHRIGSTFVHVSAGIGVSGPIRCRVGCPAEVSFITLRRRLQAVRPALGHTAGTRTAHAGLQLTARV